MEIWSSCPTYKYTQTHTRQQQFQVVMLDTGHIIYEFDPNSNWMLFWNWKRIKCTCLKRVHLVFVLVVSSCLTIFGKWICSCDDARETVFFGPSNDQYCDNDEDKTIHKNRRARMLGWHIQFGILIKCELFVFPSVSDIVYRNEIGISVI